MERKFELMNRNGQDDDFSKFIKGKHVFYKGGKLKILKYHFWPNFFSSTLVQSLPKDAE